MGLRIQNLDYGTFPCVLHHAGGDPICRSGLELKRRCFDLIGEPRRSFSFAKNWKLSALQVYRRPSALTPLRRLPQLAIVTFTSFRFPGSAELSLHHLGLEIDVVRPRAARWDHMMKIGLMKEYLDALDTDYVLFMDSHDTFVTSDVLGIVDTFRKLDCKALFQADALDWPAHATEFYDRIATGDTAYRYLCSGIFMGETAFLRRVLARAVDTPPIGNYGDQAIYKQIFPEFHPEARLDYHCELFQPLTDYRDPRRPDRFSAVDLKLEIQYRPDREPPPDVASISPRGPAALGRHLLDRLIASALTWMPEGWRGR
jgi:hypothetical protein